MEAASTQRKNLVRSLDPRMKLLLVVVISTATMFTPSREVVAWNYIIIILLWLISGDVRHAIKFALIFAMVLVVEYASLWIPNDTLKMMVSLAMILLASNSVLCGTLEIPMMLMIVIFSFMMFSSTEAMNNAIHVLRTIDVIMDKLDVIKNTPPIDENGRDIKLSKFDIDFEDVSFGYNEKKVLEHVSLHIPENTTTAIVGPSGSGKTTICNLLARFYDVDNGCIKIGGIKISDIKCDSLLANITMVFQNVYLFRDSIANNIKFGKPDATKQEVIEAAKKACCYDFIMSLPDGFDTVIGDGGATLSGGEKQRISIARAMLKDAPIVILDEATASVDPENEHLIQQAISALTHGKTILIIAHRLATIENADQILVVDHGEIVQNGTHAELLKKPGIYQNFVSIRQQSEGWSIS